MGSLRNQRGQPHLILTQKTVGCYESNIRKGTVPTENENKTRIKVARTSIQQNFHIPTRAYYTHSPISISSPFLSLPSTFCAQCRRCPRNPSQPSCESPEQRSSSLFRNQRQFHIFHFTLFNFRFHFYHLRHLRYSPISRSYIKTVATLLFIVSFIIPLKFNSLLLILLMIFFIRTFCILSYVKDVFNYIIS